ncbi:MAG: ACT domain-containing protein [Oscillospiraceae bacterium]
MNNRDRKFYVVAEDILPEALIKTVHAKELLTRGKALGIPEACEALGIARSTFYKYKDGIFTYFDLSSMDIVNISLMLDHTPGVLSSVLNEIARFKGNVLTINQSLPSHGAALVTISVGMSQQIDNPSELIEFLKSLKGVLDARTNGRTEIGGTHD